MLLTATHGGLRCRTLGNKNVFIRGLEPKQVDHHAGPFGREFVRHTIQGWSLARACKGGLGPKHHRSVITVDLGLHPLYRLPGVSC